MKRCSLVSLIILTLTLTPIAAMAQTGAEPGPGKSVYVAPQIGMILADPMVGIAAFYSYGEFSLTMSRDILLVQASAPRTGFQVSAGVIISGFVSSTIDWAPFIGLGWAPSDLFRVGVAITTTGEWLSIINITMGL